MMFKQKGHEIQKHNQYDKVKPFLLHWLIDWAFMTGLYMCV